MVDLANPRTYQTFWPRFWAGWIDTLLFLPLIPFDAWIWKATSLPVILVPWFVLSSLAFAAYSISLHAYRGQTLGKWLMGVRVLDVSGRKLALKQAFLRDSVWLVFVAYGLVTDLSLVADGQNPMDQALSSTDHIILWSSTIWLVLELATMLFNAKRRAVHDFIGRSVVVRLRGVEATAHSGPLADAKD